jgi:Family of unknown function (DUF5335)
MKREINSHDWADFCRRITRERQGALVSIETIHPDGQKRAQTGNATLQSMDLDTSGPCNDVLLLRVDNERESAFDIIDPVHIILQETHSGDDFNPVRIDGENGTTIVTFHPAIHRQMLAGLKLY